MSLHYFFLFTVSTLLLLLFQRLVLIEAIYSTRDEDGLFVLLYNEC